jgi:hypothetical protein
MAVQEAELGRDRALVLVQERRVVRAGELHDLAARGPPPGAHGGLRQRAAIAVIGDDEQRAAHGPADSDWYEYRLTERALELYPVIVGLMRWAGRHLDAEPDTVVELVHRGCGRPADPYLACSHCHEPLTGRDIEATPRS